MQTASLSFALVPFEFTNSCIAKEFNHHEIKMLSYLFPEIDKIIGTLLDLPLQPNVKKLPVERYFSSIYLYNYIFQVVSLCILIKL